MRRTAPPGFARWPQAADVERPHVHDEECRAVVLAQRGQLNWLMAALREPLAAPASQKQGGPPASPPSADAFGV